MSKKILSTKPVVENRQARYHYLIEDEVECGIILTGSEVKSIRANQINIRESYANIEFAELWLINSNIPNYDKAKTFVHDERRKRKLLVSRKELAKLWKRQGREGMALVPLKVYFNKKGLAKILVGIGKGKKLTDKRDTEKKRDWQKQKSRLLRNQS